MYFECDRYHLSDKVGSHLSDKDGWRIQELRDHLQFGKLEETEPKKLRQDK